MEYLKEFQLCAGRLEDDFHAWAGGQDTLDAIRRENPGHFAEIFKELEQLVDELWTDEQNPPDETTVNDFLWFDRQYIFQHLGLTPEGAKMPVGAYWDDADEYHESAEEEEQDD